MSGRRRYVGRGPTSRPKAVKVENLPDFLQKLVQEGKARAVTPGAIRVSQSDHASGPKPSPRSKYGAKATVVDGMRFDSKKEAEFFVHLKRLQEAGEILFFLRQVPFHLPGSTVYRADFAIFTPEGGVQFVDVKGVETEVFRLKKRQVEALYPVKIHLEKKRG